MKRFQSLIAIIIFAILPINSQEIKESGNFLTVSERYEPIYKIVGNNNNGDYGQGVYSIYVRLYFEMPKNKEDGDLRLMLAVSENIIGKKQKLSFTKIGFTFDNGHKTELFNYEQKRYLENVGSDEYVFEVTPLIVLLQTYNITSLQYGGYSANGSLYVTDKYLLRRQIETIKKPFENK